MTSRPVELTAGTRCTVRVPGSTSNLGPGFDSLGCAVSLWNDFEFEVLAPGAPEVVQLGGSCRGGIPETRDNLALATARGFFGRLGQPAPAMSLRATIEVPNTRGLGSSSTAIVAGLVAANALMGEPMTRAELLDVAVEIEGHPDNVAPAILGGMVVSAAYSRPLAWTKIPVHDSVQFLFIIPDYMVKTSEARGVLPKTLGYKDAIFNLSRTPLVVHALQTGDLRLLREAIRDCVHQPFRKPLFRNYDELEAGAYDAGAGGFCVSGAGPTMLAIAAKEHGAAVAGALRATMQRVGLAGRVEALAPDNEGSRVRILHEAAAE